MPNTGILYVHHHVRLLKNSCKWIKSDFKNRHFWSIQLSFCLKNFCFIQLFSWQQISSIFIFYKSLFFLYFPRLIWVNTEFCTLSPPMLHIFCWIFFLLAWILMKSWGCFYLYFHVSKFFLLPLVDFLIFLFYSIFRFSQFNQICLGGVVLFCFVLYLSGTWVRYLSLILVTAQPLFKYVLFCSISSGLPGTLFMHISLWFLDIFFCLCFSLGSCYWPVFKSLIFFPSTALSIQMSLLQAFFSFWF